MAVLPQEFFDHMRTSWREQLLAWRSVLDNWAGALEEREHAARARSEGHTGETTRSPRPDEMGRM